MTKRKMDLGLTGISHGCVPPTQPDISVRSRLEKDFPSIKPIEHAPGGAHEEEMLEHRIPNAHRLFEPGNPGIAGAAKPTATGVAEHIGCDRVHANDHERKGPSLPAHDF